MNSYNGYSGELRSKAQRWLNAEIASGRMVRPTVCMACGQSHGIVDMHAEDYSEPFAAGKTDEFHLCFYCHMSVHCRFRNIGAWDCYRQMIGCGYKFQAFEKRNFPLFMQSFSQLPQGLLGLDTFTVATLVPPTRLVLDEIDGWLLKHTGKGWR